MTIVLALGAATFFGLADFISGIASRRTSPWPVAVLAALGGLATSLVLVAFTSGHPSAVDVAWGIFAGVGGGFGSVTLYRGIVAGRMAVATPLSAVGAYVLPGIAGLVVGEHPTWLVWAGVLVTPPGIWLVSHELDAQGTATQEMEHPRFAAGVRDGLVAGVGFGMLFMGLGQVPANAGYGPLAASQTAASVTVLVLAVALGNSVKPTDRSQLWALAGGALLALALVCFSLASQSGLLSVAAVLTSLYPGVTIVLAILLLREPIRGSQWVGLALCGIAVGLVAAG